MRLLLSLFCIVLCSSGCEETTNNQLSYNLKTRVVTKEHPGKKLMEINCYVCHSPTATHDTRIAPPMFAVKNHYIKKSSTKEEFINNIQNWISNPSKENARMHGAVRRFGLMPKQEFSEETIREIADYLYDFDNDKHSCSENALEKPNHKKRKENL